MQALVEVVERNGQRKHEARVGRTEEVLVEGPSKKTDAMWSGRSRQNKLVHFAPDGRDAAGRARQGPRDGRCAALAAGRDHKPRATCTSAACAHSRRGGVTRHLALVGATASGKSALALAVARHAADVEIVSLDSMQVYRGMDIGTAKPTPSERAIVPHHLVDVVDPDQEWSVRETQRAASAAIAAIDARGRRALLVGGTGLYVRAVVDGLAVPPRAPETRRALEQATGTLEGLAAAYERLRRFDPDAAARIEPGNRRRIVRALEVFETTGRPFSTFGAGLTEYARPAIPVELVGVWLSRAELVATNLPKIRHDARRRTRRGGTGAGRAPGGPVPHRPSGHRLQGSARASRRPHPDTRRRARPRRPPHPALRPPPAGVVPARSPHPLARGRPKSGRIGPHRAGTLEGRQRGGPGCPDHMTKLQLSKLHATGNDFLVQLALEPGAEPVPAGHVAALCDRHRGIGADGLITILAGADGADCTMVLRNADGGAAEMSGNGIRTLAWVAARAGLGTPATLVVDTGSGRRMVDLVRDAAGDVTHATVDMGPVTLGEVGVVITVHGTDYCGDVAGVGNPHFVCFVDDPATTRVTTHGPIIERNARFADRTNVEFVRVAEPETLEMRVWERGAGETLSCGTGACAAAAVAHAHGLVGEELRVCVPGGELEVALGDTVRLGGPVVHVFDVDAEVP